MKHDYKLFDPCPAEAVSQYIQDQEEEGWELVNVSVGMQPVRAKSNIVQGNGKPQVGMIVVISPFMRKVAVE